ncbi:hypothetical protein ACFFGR_23065 [Arthrobacter liuii]|nr:hypothetical protein [Arthrobacter liuii]
MDTAPWVWVVVAVVVVALIVLLLLAGGRRRKAMQEKRDREHREKAAEIRREAENMEIDAREREAKAIRARADAEQAQVDAARLRQEAEQRSQEAQSLRGDVASHARKADELDPDVGRDGSPRDHREVHEGRQVQADGAVRNGRGPSNVGPGQEAGRQAEYVDGGHADVGQGHGSREPLAGDAGTSIPEAEPRRRQSDATDTAAGHDVRDEGNPRTGI